MMYVRRTDLAKSKQDIAQFVQQALRNSPPSRTTTAQ
jgi:hypothetical protein